MDDRREGESGSAGTKPEQIIYPRVFIPIEKRNLDGTMQFRTSDREVYLRDLNGAIRRKTPKVKKHHGPRRG